MPFEECESRISIHEKMTDNGTSQTQRDDARNAPERRERNHQEVIRRMAEYLNYTPTMDMYSLQHFVRVRRALSAGQYMLVVTRNVADAILIAHAMRILPGVVHLQLIPGQQPSVAINCPLYHNMSMLMRERRVDMAQRIEPMFTRNARAERLAYMLQSTQWIRARQPPQQQNGPTGNFNMFLVDQDPQHNNGMYSMLVTTEWIAAETRRMMRLAIIARAHQNFHPDLREIVLAACMGLHPRLGERSPLRLLSAAVVEVYILGTLLLLILD